MSEFVSCVVCGGTIEAEEGEAKLPEDYCCETCAELYEAEPA